MGWLGKKIMIPKKNANIRLKRWKNCTMGKISLKKGGGAKIIYFWILVVWKFMDKIKP